MTSSRTVRPRDGRPTTIEPTLGPVIAIIGSDGAGKSTVGNALLAWLRESRPVELCHLGKQTGNVGRALARMPLLGGRVDRTLVHKAGHVHDETGPGALIALATYMLSMRRVRRFRRMLAVRRKGVTVIADRYPQTSVLGPKLDGPHLVAPTNRNIVARLLARRERRLYDWMASYRPDLVIRLNVDLPTAAARKPDHRYSSLAAKVSIVPRLSFNGAPIVDIDAGQPLETVLAQARQAITEMLSRDGDPGNDPA